MVLIRDPISLPIKALTSRGFKVRTHFAASQRGWWVFLPSGLRGVALPHHYVGLFLCQELRKSIPAAKLPECWSAVDLQLFLTRPANTMS